MLDELPVDVLGDGLSYPGHVNLCQCFGYYAFFVQIVILRQGTAAELRVRVDVLNKVLTELVGRTSPADSELAGLVPIGATFTIAPLWVGAA